MYQLNSKKIVEEKLIPCYVLHLVSFYYFKIHLKPNSPKFLMKTVKKSIMLYDR